MREQTLLRAIEAEPENTNEEFNFGTLAVGFVVAQSQESAGFGLLVAWDTEEPEPGLQILIGPLAIWWRRHFPVTVSVAKHILYPRSKHA